MDRVDYNPYEFIQDLTKCLLYHGSLYELQGGAGDLFYPKYRTGRQYRGTLYRGTSRSPQAVRGSVDIFYYTLNPSEQ